MHNTRRKPDNADTLVPSRQIIYQISTEKDFVEVRDAYEKALQNIKGWKNVAAHHIRRNLSTKPTEDMIQWPRGLSSEAIYNMISDVGKAAAIECMWFVTSILQDNPSYFVFDTRKGVPDNTPGGMIARANGFCRHLGSPKGRIYRKYAGQTYLERYVY